MVFCFYINLNAFYICAFNAVCLARGLNCLGCVRGADLPAGKFKINFAFRFNRFLSGLFRRRFLYGFFFFSRLCRFLFFFLFSRLFRFNFRFLAFRLYFCGLFLLYSLNRSSRLFFTLFSTDLTSFFFAAITKILSK